MKRVKFVVSMLALTLILVSCGRSNSECYTGSTDPNCPVSYGTNQYGGNGGYNQQGNGYDSYGGDYSGGQQQGYGGYGQQGNGYGQQQGYGYGN